MAEKKYTLSLQLTADGSQAKSELEKVGKAAEETARRVEKPKRIPAKVKEDLSRPKAALIPKPATAGKAPAVSAAASAPASWDVHANIRPAVEEAYKARQAIDQMGQSLLPWQVRLDRPAMAIDAKPPVRPAMAIGAKEAARPESAAGIISAGRKFSLRPIDKEAREKLDDLKAKSVTWTIQADGAPALAEGEKTKKGLEAQGKKIPPWKVRLQKFGNTLQEFGKGLYGNTLKGFGGDMSSMLGLDKIGSGMQSGLGRALSWASAGFSSLWKVAGFAFSGIWSGVRMAGSLLKSMLLAPVRLATGAFKALGVGAAAALAGIYAGLKALGPAAEMQQFQIQVETMLKDPKKAKQRLDELKKYAKDTNYGPKEIIEAGNLMEAFGFYSLRNLKLAGDAANAFGKDINEIVRSLNYLASGRGGEAFESLARIGVTREKLKPFGVEFEKSGELKTDPKKAMEAVLLYFETQFGGMTERQKKTWKGAMQQMGGEVYNSFDVGFKKALGPLTEFVQGRAIPLIESIGKRLELIDWKKVLSGPLKLLGGVAEMIRQAMDPETAAAGMKNLKIFGSWVWEGLKKVIGLLPSGFKAFIGDLAGVLESFISSGGMGKLLNAGWQMLKLSWQLGASLLSTVLTSFSREFQSNLKIIVEKMFPGGRNPETTKRSNAEWVATRAALLAADDRELARARRDAALSESEEARKQAGQTYIDTRHTVDPAKMEDFQKRAAANAFEKAMRTYGDADFQKKIAEHLRKNNQAINDQWQKAFEKAMGYDDPTTSPFYVAPEKLNGAWSDALKGLSDIKLPELNFNKTTAWGEQFKNEAVAAFTGPADVIRKANAGGDRRSALEKREEDLLRYRQSLIDDPELAGYRREGWNKKGEERKSTDPDRNRRDEKDRQYAKARENAWRRGEVLRIEIGRVEVQLKENAQEKARNARASVSRTTEAIKGGEGANTREVIRQGADKETKEIVRSIIREGAKETNTREIIREGADRETKEIVRNIIREDAKETNTRETIREGADKTIIAGTNKETIRETERKSRERESPKSDDIGGLSQQVALVNNTIGQGNQQVSQRLAQGFADMSLLLGQNINQNKSIIAQMEKMNKYLDAVMGVA